MGLYKGICSSRIAWAHCHEVSGGGYCRFGKEGAIWNTLPFGYSNQEGKWGPGILNKVVEFLVSPDGKYIVILQSRQYEISSWNPLTSALQMFELDFWHVSGPPNRAVIAS